ncbi:dynein regulatory complex protein 10 isoform X1 [Gopherus flavomarginatus]|uniref:dynein regulatory complex protein 10 isoform X1 n=1 Tax=Gopherus flavomarginatus TaxID=286002 RepID=UPI0021CBE097|nr:dynein regulatory complex protein 10 isoform X1 [Gopherus flavomarginatus]XP_050779795.1 dynein regulatory complex protein 10 isoform X2 [Gopherus flavomarginatus]XP_050779796.1 dynein regulatory complex protein 10 isoform X3 [Gopherus flavomarginatus]XP_050779797.1 dynein regulatory complex protein 10 isoform X4 [Gopherus flavomarginatus]XP_050779798.1 dynein regulatory complex protein 10 isoform X1 [Gopherus flavomarginatus]
MATKVATMLQLPYESTDSSSKSSVGHSQTPKKSAIKTSPLKLLDPGRSKLTTVETKRIISVLDEAIFKVELISLISHITEFLDDLSTILGSELMGTLKEHERLSNNMEALLTQLQREGLKEEDGRGDLVGTEEQIRHLQLHQQAVKSSIRNILRLFQADPLASQAVRDEAYARDLSFEIFIKGLSEFRGFLLEKLLTSPLEEQEKVQFMEEISLRDKKNTETIAALEAELATAIQSRDNEIMKMNAVIRDLKSHLLHLEKSSESHIQRTKQEAEKLQKGELRISQAKCAKIQQDIHQLRAQLNVLIIDNRDSELALRKKKYKVEMEIENWIQKYDADMGEKQTEFEEADAVYTEEKAQLAELKEKYAVLEQEYSQIKEERRRSQEKKERAERELAIMVRAATHIQAFWKGYLVRSLLKSKRKKKGKGKKSKK